MTSARKIAANQVNGRKSRGPRTAAGKARASRNAFRHGLSGITQHNPIVYPQIAQMAKAICADLDDAFLFEQALIIAENDLLLACVRSERVAVIERLRDGKLIAFMKRGSDIAHAKTRFAQAKLAEAELDQIKARFATPAGEFPSATTMVVLENEPASGWTPREPENRDEAEAMREGLPQLERLARYERRAWSRRKRAFRRYLSLRIELVQLTSQ